MDGLVVHVPHSALTIPEDVRRCILLTDEQLERELLLMTDRYTDALFDLPGATVIRYPVSRLVVDPERFLDDVEEPMSKRGMGAVYTRTSEGAPLREQPIHAERQNLIERFYSPHHALLEKVVDDALVHHGRCLVLDGHSFPSQPLPYELDQSLNRPDICLGTDPYHSPQDIVFAAHDAFASAGYRVEIDRPFSGCMVPLKHYKRRKDVRALMVEINRSLYMNEATGERRPDFHLFAAELRSIAGKFLG